MLTDEEAKALERCRNHNGSPETTYDLVLLYNALLRLYPPGWNDPVTPERLVELGFKYDESRKWYVSPNGMLWWTPGKYGSPDHWRVGGAYIVTECEPRNMKEARELLVRCGAIKEEK